MNTVKRLAYGAASGALLIPSVVAAQFELPANTFGIADDADLVDSIAAILNWLLLFVGIVAIVMFVVGGILYLTAAGNEEQAEKAKNTITYAIIGLIVVLISYVLVRTIAGFFGAGPGATV